MAFKLRSPLENKPNEFGSVPIAASSKGYGGYQSMLKDRLRSTAPENRVGGSGGGTQSTGTFPDPQTGKERYYDKAHQSYSSKTGLVNKTGNFKNGVYNLNKPETKAESIIPAGQGGGSPFNNTYGLGEAIPDDGKMGSKKYVEKNPDLMTKSEILKKDRQEAFDNIDEKDLEKTRTSNVTKNNQKNKPDNKNTSNKTTPSKPSNTITTGSNDNVDKSGGYLKDTKNFSLDVDTEIAQLKQATKMNTSSMPKFEKSVTNARSADYDMIRAKGRGRRDRLKTRLDKSEARVANRNDASSMRIKSRQQKSGERYASKMEASTNTGTNPGTNPGKLESQKKLDAFEKTMDSPKATAYKKPSANLPKNPGITSGSISPGPSVNVLKSGSASLNPAKTKSKPSMKLNTSTQTTGFIDDSKIKKGAKQAKGGKKVKASTYESLTGFKNKKGSSDGMRRGMSSANTSIKVPNLSRGPKA